MIVSWATEVKVQLLAPWRQGAGGVLGALVKVVDAELKPLPIGRAEREAFRERSGLELVAELFR